MPTHFKGTPQEILALNTFIKLTRAVESFSARLARRHTIEDLTPSQFGALETLHHLGPQRQSDISAKLLKSTGNMTLVVDNLEKRGLVRRARDAADRRVVMVSLTADGEALIRRIFPGHVAAIVDEMRVLSSEEQAALGRLCRKLGTGEPE